MGEKFSPDLHTGTGNFTVPITLPPGRNGFQPQLDLVYSTGSGNGPFGFGWSLSIPGVSRQTSRGIPHYDDSQDTFILSGAEDLVPVSIETHGITRYRPRTESLFARIEHYRNQDDDYWQVRTKDGLLSRYGTPRPDNSPLAWQDPAVIADPSNKSKIFAWKLSHTVDPFGNQIVYEYEPNSGQLGLHRWHQLYLKRIRYADYTEKDQTKFLISVTFFYEDRPSDPFSEYRSGFEIRTTRRCSRIEIHTHAGVDRLVYTYEFEYLDERAEMEQFLPLNGVSLLSQVKIKGHDGDQTEELPPLEFGYSRFEPQGRKFFRVQGTDLPSHSLAHPDLELADLFGHGLPDLLEMNGVVRYWRNLGGGRFASPQAMAAAPAGLQLAQAGTQLIDADGDGRLDLMLVTERLAGYFPMRFGGLWDRRSFQPYRQAPSFDLEDPEVRLLDLTGDGVTDAMRSGSRLECFFNDPKEGWNGTRWVERQAIEFFPNINFSDPRVKLADMTGDGLQDIILVYDGCIEYWPNLGYGNWGQRISMTNSPRLPYGYDPRRILVGDVDGDGLADLIYVDDTRVTLWVNQSGNGWSNPIEIQGTPPVSDIDAVRLADLFGSGISGILWSAEATTLSPINIFFLDFSGGVKPYLLNEMDNHRGAVTLVQYAPSTRFYLEDERRPETRWQTPLPFPVQVVTRVEVIDAISGSKLTTEYSYHHGYWDGAEREFCGFGRVDQRDTEEFDTFNTPGLQPGRSFERVQKKAFSPPLETRTWFQQGPIGDEFGDWTEADYKTEYWPGDPPVLARPQAMVDTLKELPRRIRRDALRTLRGGILRTELYALDGTDRQEQPYSVTEVLYGVREELPPGPGEDRLHLFFPHFLAQRITQWERGDDPMTQFTFTDDYDAYGQPRLQTAIAVPRDRDFRSKTSPGEPYLATHTVTTYVQRDDADHYLIGRTASITSYEILNDGSPGVFELHAAVLDGSASRRIIGQTLNFYDGSPFQGLPFSQLGDYGLMVRTESLILTEQILAEAYQEGTPERPPYLVPGSDPAWTPDYPPEFRDLLMPLAGYIFQPGGTDPPYERGYFVATERWRYDCQEQANGQGRGLITANRNPVGRDTTVTYDSYELLPVEIANPAGLKTRASYDYRVLQPGEVIDPNGNRTIFTFTPLGLLAGTAVMGKTGENEGDTLAAPGIHLVYDFLAFMEHGQPVFVRTIRRMHHVNEADIPLPERNETIEMIEYSDGFGRLVQARTQAEEVIFGQPVFGGELLPPVQAGQNTTKELVGQRNGSQDHPNVLVSGWQIYDNKGRVVERYETFFSTGWAYQPPTREQAGQKVTMFYDPHGQVIRTLNPDGSEQQIIFGRPEDLAVPERFSPTPWEVYTYDANDNAGRTHPTLSTGFKAHWNTPASTVVDALGRAIIAVVRNGPNPETDWFTTRSTYDIRGNLLTATDALGRVAFKHVYDLANRPWRIESIDAGLRSFVLDALGNIVEQRDSKGALVLRAYDLLQRLFRLWAQDGADQALTLRERMVYGDAAEAGLTSEQAAAANLLGQLYLHYDEAGRITFETYDFKGNILEKVRQVIDDTAILAVFDPPPPDWQVPAFRVNWQPPAGTTLEGHAGKLLEAALYRTSVAYDAVNRIKTIRYPEDVAGKRQELRPRYNRAGILERVELDGVTFVEHIAYNAKGQRTLIAYGNGIMTRYAYNPQSFRLARLRSERFNQPAAFTYRPAGPPLQELAYRYDLVGNVTLIQDRTPDSGIPNTPLGPHALDRAFTYDPLYRLVSATGRECDLPPTPPWESGPRCADLTRSRGYTEQYTYDPACNLKQWQRQVTGGGSTRTLTLAPGSNRLASMTIGQTTYHYTYDPNGNMLRETTSRHFEWEYGDRLRVFRVQAGQAEPSLHAHYLYDGAGQRVKKLLRKQGGQVEVTVYIDGIFEHHHFVRDNTREANNTLHVMDDQARIALVRVGPPFPGDTTPAVQYLLGDHLGSSNVVVDDQGLLVNREEFTPYGETGFGSFARKRYRFTGKERDEESGLSYHGARYYAPWLARWTSCDPAGVVDGLNLYQYVRSNPTRLVDKTGMQSTFEQELMKLPPEERARIGEAYKKATGSKCNPATHCCDPPKQPEPNPNQTYMGVDYWGNPVSGRGEMDYQKKLARSFWKTGVENIDAFKGAGGGVGGFAASLFTDDPKTMVAAANLGSAVEGLAAGGVTVKSAVKAKAGQGGGGQNKPPSLPPGGSPPGNSPPGGGSPSGGSPPQFRLVGRTYYEDPTGRRYVAVEVVATGEIIPFYRSTGNNSGTPGQWYPHGGFTPTFPGMGQQENLVKVPGHPNYPSQLTTEIGGWLSTQSSARAFGVFLEGYTVEQVAREVQAWYEQIGAPVSYPLVNW
jgi:RHS repeat-associated protein